MLLNKGFQISCEDALQHGGGRVLPGPVGFLIIVETGTRVGLGINSVLFSEGGDLIYVAELGKEVVAFLSIEVYKEDGYIYLDDFSVTAACRNKGIGSKLISLAENYSESIGISAIVLHVEKTNESAHQLYRKLGYLDHEDQGNRILMVKELRK